MGPAGIGEPGSGWQPGRRAGTGEHIRDDVTRSGMRSGWLAGMAAQHQGWGRGWRADPRLEGDARDETGRIADQGGPGATTRTGSAIRPGPGACPDPPQSLRVDRDAGLGWGCGARGDPGARPGRIPLRNPRDRDGDRDGESHHRAVPRPNGRPMTLTLDLPARRAPVRPFDTLHADWADATGPAAPAGRADAVSRSAAGGGTGGTPGW
jgi:hypothetical protein